MGMLSPKLFTHGEGPVSGRDTRRINNVLHQTDIILLSEDNELWKQVTIYNVLTEYKLKTK
jgi:hypothetical protein